MRTGNHYRESLRDGRKVWVLGMGDVEDVTTHPATAGMVKEYAAWYDRHLDPEWQERLLAPADSKHAGVPVAFIPPARRAGISLIRLVTGR